MYCMTRAGHYRALEWSEAEQKYIENPNLGILVEVDVSLRHLCPVHSYSSHTTSAL